MKYIAVCRIKFSRRTDRIKNTGCPHWIDSIVPDTVVLIPLFRDWREKKHSNSTLSKTHDILYPTGGRQKSKAYHPCLKESRG